MEAFARWKEGMEAICNTTYNIDHTVRRMTLQMYEDFEWSIFCLNWKICNLICSGLGGANFVHHFQWSACRWDRTSWWEREGGHTTMGLKLEEVHEAVLVCIHLIAFVYLLYSVPRLKLYLELYLVRIRYDYLFITFTLSTKFTYYILFIFLIVCILHLSGKPSYGSKDHLFSLLFNVTACEFLEHSHFSVLRVDDVIPA